MLIKPLSQLPLHCALLFLPMTLLAQKAEPVIKAIGDPALTLQRWLDNIPQEKAYLHMDKPYYAQGDTVWFKGYLTNGSRHQLTAISGAVYVDLINEYNQPIRKLKLPANSGTFSGCLILADDIIKGSYTLRAYTQWMRNAGEDYFFNRTFTIGDFNIKQTGTTAKKGGNTATQQTDIQFFPEGGSLVSGLSSRVGFKAVGADGLGQAISGNITDNDNNEVAVISTLHAGMGSLLLKPLAGKTYKANIKLADGNIKAIALPAALNQGYVLAVYQPNKDSILVRIQATESLQNSTVNLVVHSSGELMYTVPVKLSGAMTSLWLQKEPFPSGIAQFTLFNTNNEPLNERIAFIKRGDEMQLAIKTPKAVYGHREKIQLELNAKQAAGTPVAANFSVAVIDESKTPVDESAESTILSNTLLTSDLKGYIERPNYYFGANTDDVNRALDNLMLTQGYRRFDWKAIANNPNLKPEFKPEKQGISISGTVQNLKHNTVEKAVVMLVSLNARMNMTAFTDANGRFSFDNLVFADSAKFAIQARIPDSKLEAIIKIDSLPAMTITRKPNLADAHIIEQNLQKAADEGKPAKLTGLHVLKEVQIKAVKVVEDENNDAMRQGSWTQKDISVDKVLRIEDPEMYNTVGEFLLARVPGVSIQTGATGVSALVDMRPSLSVGGATAASRAIGVMINGMPNNYDIDDMLNGRVVRPEDVDRIQIIRTSLPAKERMRSTVDIAASPAGFINIILKHPSQRKQYNPAMANLMPKGYNKMREFYSPKYDSPQVNSSIPDLRTTIYWNPYVNTDANGEAKFDFYNGDGSGTYRVVVEGINAEGELARQVYRYRVE